MTLKGDTVFNQTTIIGVGLIGGSLGGALKAKGLSKTVVGVGRDKDNLDVAVERGLIDRYYHDARKGVQGSDLVILCCPVGLFESVTAEIKPYLDDQAIVTDAGSVKGDLVERIEELLYPKARYVPAHPIAGSEQSGAAAANIRLFEGARCIITPTRNTDMHAMELIEDLWEAIGMVTHTMDPHEHDKVFALVSHLPHVAAYAMVTAISEMEGGDRAITYAAGGFKDFTRIAGSHPGMWRDICILNRENILGAIDSYQQALWKLREFIDKGDGEQLADEFENARVVRARIK